MRLIDADALKKAFKNKGEGMFKLSRVRDIINNAPTVTPSLSLDNITEDDVEKFKMIWQRATSKGLLATIEERPHGKWNEIVEPFGWDDIKSAQCSACGESYPYPTDCGFDDIVEMFKFCPECGAQMEAGTRWKEEGDDE